MTTKFMSANAPVSESAPCGAKSIQPKKKSARDQIPASSFEALRAASERISKMDPKDVRASTKDELKAIFASV